MLIRPLVWLILPLLALGAPAAAQRAPDGRAAFARCAGCHSPRPGVKMRGPSLFGVVGRPAGKQPDFRYSPAMQSARFRWGPAQLDQFLKGPRQAVPGTQMIAPGVTDPATRAAIIRYLATLR